MEHGFQGDSVVFGSYAPTFDPTNQYQGLIVYGTSLVGPGVEFPDVAALPRGPGAAGVTAGEAAIDISSHTITIQAPAGNRSITTPDVPFDGYVMEFSGHPGTFITGVTVEKTNVKGFTDADITVFKHDIEINLANLHFKAGIAPSTTLDVTFGHRPVAASAKSLITGEA